MRKGKGKKEELENAHEKLHLAQMWKDKAKKEELEDANEKLTNNPTLCT